MTLDMWVKNWLNINEYVCIDRVRLWEWGVFCCCFWAIESSQRVVCLWVMCASLGVALFCLSLATHMLLRRRAQRGWRRNRRRRGEGVVAQGKSTSNLACLAQRAAQGGSKKECERDILSPHTSLVDYIQYVYLSPSPTLHSLPALGKNSDRWMHSCIIAEK